MNKNSWRYLAAATLILTGLGSGVVASAQPAAATAADPAAVSALVSAIDAEVAKVPSTGSVDDFQGAVAFAIDQSKQPQAVVIEALKRIEARKNGKSLKQALKNLLGTYEGGTGTGGIGGGGTGAPAATGATLGSGPAVTGGGSTNYTTTP